MVASILWCIFSGCAIAFGIMGYLINMPNGVRRYSWRLSAVCCYAVSLVVLLAALPGKILSLQWWIFVVLLVTAFSWVSGTWRKLERYRDLERRTQTPPIVKRPWQ